MDLKEALLKAKNSYYKCTKEEKGELTKLIIGIKRPERVVLNVKKLGRKKWKTTIIK